MCDLTKTLLLAPAFDSYITKIVHLALKFALFHYLAKVSLTS